MTVRQSIVEKDILTKLKIHRDRVHQPHQPCVLLVVITSVALSAFSVPACSCAQVHGGSAGGCSSCMDKCRVTPRSVASLSHGHENNHSHLRS